MATFHAWFRTEPNNEDPHQWTSDVEASDEKAAFAQAYHALVIGALDHQVT
jgi:hypothetical protein